jgi:hypothetical protein
MASCMRLNPGPDVAVNAFAPASDAPITALADAISSSACRKRNSGCSAACPDATLRISVDGLMGYPA